MLVGWVRQALSYYSLSAEAARVENLRDQNLHVFEPPLFDAEDLKPYNRYEHAAAWTAENCVHPAINSGGIEPYNAIASVCSLPKVDKYALPPTKFLSPSWFAQGISTGLGATVPYTIAGKAAGGTLRFVGASIGAEGTCAAIFKSPHLAMILGGAAYDGLRVPEQGRTRLSNALGGAAAFTIFEYGSPLVSQLGRPSRFMAMAGIGGFAAGTQFLIADGIAKGKMPDSEDMTRVIIGGAAMNLALPATKSAIQTAIDKINVGVGRGVDAHEYFARQPLNLSPALTKILAENPWLRVQPGAAETRLLPGSRLLHIKPGDSPDLIVSKILNPATPLHIQVPAR